MSFYDVTLLLSVLFHNILRVCCIYAFSPSDSSKAVDASDSSYPIFSVSGVLVTRVVPSIVFSCELLVFDSTESTCGLSRNGGIHRRSSFC